MKFNSSKVLDRSAEDIEKLVRENIDDCFGEEHTFVLIVPTLETGYGNPFKAFDTRYSINADTLKKLTQKAAKKAEDGNFIDSYLDRNPDFALSRMIIKENVRLYLDGVLGYAPQFILVISNTSHYGDFHVITNFDQEIFIHFLHFVLNTVPKEYNSRH